MWRLNDVLSLKMWINFVPPLTPVIRLGESFSSESDVKQIFVSLQPRGYSHSSIETLYSDEGDSTVLTN